MTRAYSSSTLTRSLTGAVRFRGLIFSSEGGRTYWAEAVELYGLEYAWYATSLPWITPRRWHGGSLSWASLNPDFPWCPLLYDGAPYKSGIVLTLA